MKTPYQCGDHTALVGYLYDECEPDERASIVAHVASCAACAAELAALQSTRIQLASWSPPDAELGFVIARAAPSAPPEPRRRWAWFVQPLPAWAQLAAAAAIFAAGVSLGIAGGALRDAPASTATAAMPVATAAPVRDVSSASLDALEQRLRDEIAQLRPSAAAASAVPAPIEGSLLARVRALIDESEQRQQQELALRTAQIVRDFDSQRQVDLEQIQRNFGQIEGLTGAEVREQRQMLNYLMRVSQQR